MRIAYLGGSITEGYGASKEEFTYRALTTKWFEEWTGEKIDEINAGIGGTGSDLAVFRTDKDVVAYNPDLVFVEFAVNDSNRDDDIIIRSFDGIVQKLFACKKDMKIVFLYTLCDTQLDIYAKGEMPNSIICQHKVAEYYNIPEINVGRELYKYMQETGTTLSDYLIDGCHPADAGYSYYAETIRKTFPEIEFDIKVKEPMQENSFLKAYIVPADEFATGDWKLDTEGMYGRTKTCIYSDVIGSEIVYNFTGSGIGLYLAIEKDSGDIIYSIDGGEETEYRVWDEFAKIFNRANYVLMYPNLKQGDHTLKIRISDKKDAESEGYKIKIGGFMVC